MENEQTPEREPGIYIECDTCSKEFRLNPDSAHLFLFLHPSDTRYSFIQMLCPDGHITRQFVDIEDAVNVGPVSEVTSMQRVPNDIRDYLKEQWKNRLNNAVEAQSRVVEVAEKAGGLVVGSIVEVQWDAFIEYVEPWEIIEYGHWRVDKHEV